MGVKDRYHEPRQRTEQHRVLKRGDEQTPRVHAPGSSIRVCFFGGDDVENREDDGSIERYLEQERRHDHCAIADDVGGDGYPQVRGVAVGAGQAADGGLVDGAVEAGSRPYEVDQPDR